MNNIKTGDPPQKTKIFLSYSRKDSVFAEGLRDRLLASGFDAYLDKHDILPGEPWQERLGGLIETADTVVFCMSPYSISSKIVDWEVNEAERLEKRILPVIVTDPDAEKVPQRLKRLNYIFLRHEAEQAEQYARLIAALDTDIAWIRDHTRLGEQALAWEKAGRPNSKLLRGGDIAAAEQWQARRPDSEQAPTELHFSYIEASREQAINELKTAKRRARVIAAASLAVTVFVSWLGIQMYGQWQEGLHRESLVLADSTRQLIKEADPVSGLLLGLEGIQDKKGQTTTQRFRQQVPVTIGAFNAALSNVEWFSTALTGHSDTVNNIIFSPDGQKIVTFSDDHTARIWDTRTLKIQHVLKGHTDRVSNGEFSPDGGRLLTLSQEKTAILWDVGSGREIVTLPFPKKYNHRPAFSKDSRHFLLSHDSNSARIYSTKTGVLISMISHPSYEQIQISPSGTKVFSTKLNSENIIIWDLTTGQRMGQIFADSEISSLDHMERLAKVQAEFLRLTGQPSADLKTGNVKRNDGQRAIRIPKSDRWLVSFCRSGSDIGKLKCELRLHANDNNREIARIREGDHGSETFSDNGHFLLTEHPLGSALWDTQNGTRLGILPGLHSWSAKFSPSNDTIIGFSAGQTPAVWKKASFSNVHTILARSRWNGYMPQVEFSPTGDRVLLLEPQGDSSDRTGVLWDGTLSKKITLFKYKDTAFLLSAFSPNGNNFLIIENKRKATIRNAQTGSIIRDNITFDKDISSIAYSPNGKYLLASAANKTWVLDNLGETKAILTTRSESFMKVRFSPSGQTIAGISPHDKATLHIWPLTDLSSPYEIFEPTRAIKGFEFGPKGKRLLTWYDKGHINIWDIFSGTKIQSIKATDNIFSPPHISTDGSYLAVGLERWDIKSGQNFSDISHDGSIILAFSFNNAGDRIVTGDEYGKVMLWNAPTGKKIMELKGHGNEPVLIAAFSDNDQYILTAVGREKGFGFSGTDKTIRVWDTITGAEIFVLDGHMDGVNFAKFNPDRTGILSVAGDATVRFWPLSHPQALLERMKKWTSRCLTLAQRTKFHLSPTPPRWCYTMRKWPYHDHSKTPPPPLSLDERFLQAWDAIGGDRIIEGIAKAQAWVSKLFTRLQSAVAQAG